MNYPGGPSNVSGQRGMTTVHAHLRRGRAVRQHQRRITPASRLYRIETQGAHRETGTRLLLELGGMGMPSTHFYSLKVKPGQRHWFTRAGWDRYGLKAYEKLRRRYNLRPRVLHRRLSKGMRRPDPYQAIG